MMAKLRRVLRDEGPGGVARRLPALAWRRGIRPLLPGVGPFLYSGIPVAVERKPGDRTVPRSWRPAEAEDRPRYEEALVAALRQFVQSGDRVVVVGGGMGVTATLAALRAGDDGRVECFEGGRQRVDRILQTARLNGVAERVVVRHAVVGRAVEVYGTPPAGGAVAPEDLPACDVLELDCEGAEVEILEKVAIRPRVLVVETHGFRGSPAARVAGGMEKLGYRVEDRGPAEPDAEAYCLENDVRVLVGIRDGGRVA